MSENQISPTDPQDKILLIGDIGSAFSDAGSVGGDLCTIYSSMLDAIEAAATGDFSIIAVVLSKVCDDPDSALKALRKLDARTKIVLLARMYEEPTARRMVNYNLNGSTLADDYLICPLEAKSFYREILSANQKQQNQMLLSKTSLLQQEKLQHLERLATTDELTDLRNRRYVREFGRQIVELARKTDTKVTLLIFDIDNFKRYNDTYGHPVGDEILKQASVLINRCCRTHDVVARVGGDEFAVIFWSRPIPKQDKPGSERRSVLAQPPQEAVFIAKRFISELNKAKLDSLGPVGKGILTISGGLASFPRDARSIEELFVQADKALIEAKRSGKNRVYLVGKSESVVD